LLAMIFLLAIETAGDYYARQMVKLFSDMLMSAINVLASFSIESL